MVLTRRQIREEAAAAAAAAATAVVAVPPPPTDFVVLFSAGIAHVSQSIALLGQAAPVGLVQAHVLITSAFPLMTDSFDTLWSLYREHDRRLDVVENQNAANAQQAAANAQQVNDMHQHVQNYVAVLENEREDLRQQLTVLENEIDDLHRRNQELTSLLCVQRLDRSM